MDATLNSLINYSNGYIDVIETLDEPLAVSDAEPVEMRCRGWGASNAVVLYDGNHYLATVDDGAGDE